MLNNYLLVASWGEACAALDSRREHPTRWVTLFSKTALPTPNLHHTPPPWPLAIKPFLCFTCNDRSLVALTNYGSIHFSWHVLRDQEMQDTHTSHTYTCPPPTPTNPHTPTCTPHTTSTSCPHTHTNHLACTVPNPSIHTPTIHTDPQLTPPTPPHPHTQKNEDNHPRAYAHILAQTLHLRLHPTNTIVVTTHKFLAHRLCPLPTLQHKTPTHKCYTNPTTPISPGNHPP